MVLSFRPRPIGHDTRDGRVIVARSSPRSRGHADAERDVTA